MDYSIRENNFPYKNETYLIINAAIEVHKTLGCGFLEIVYKDALVIELESRGHFFEREKYYPVYYKGILLRHSFNADFVVFDSVILEIKSKSGIANEDLAQSINYLKCSGCSVGLILNFGKPTLEIRRVVL
ncbi:GxxExxY protein [Pedobacter changchengzhani]|uniref:GxxExxY protein n=1 Tax=Pedobacter changchengzhani TaxID=2529274 RepID=A0A4R5MJQ9_9SPHI|nr:GxxExxY protein [Pedobacter changchengzhani]TDG35319.1 GxxExxY protein [Pedobacter changchengzhani]